MDKQTKNRLLHGVLDSEIVFEQAYLLFLTSTRNVVCIYTFAYLNASLIRIFNTVAVSRLDHWFVSSNQWRKTDSFSFLGMFISHEYDCIFLIGTRYILGKTFHVDVTKDTIYRYCIDIRYRYIISM